MQSRTAARRAAPPRPTLLVGDLVACHAAFGRLQQRVLELSLKQQASIEEPHGLVEAWRDLVPLCRSLRETLTSLRELSHFTREVYECTADVCARAQDYPEVLKALQQLVHLIYPALAAQLCSDEVQQAAAAAPAGQPDAQAPQGLTRGTPLAGASSSSRPAASSRWAARSSSSSSRWAAGSSSSEQDDDHDEGFLAGIGDAATLDSSLLAAALQQREFQRWPEVAAALVLYFASVQQGMGRLDTLTTLRRLPLPLLRTPEVQLALRLHAALTDGDFVRLFRVRQAAPLLMQLVVDAAAPRVREQAVVVMAAAYRNIAAVAVCRMLQLEGGTRQLMGCLKLLATRGHLAAQRALDGLQQEDQPATADLVFKG